MSHSLSLSPHCSLSPMGRADTGSQRVGSAVLTFPPTGPILARSCLHRTVCGLLGHHQHRLLGWLGTPGAAAGMTAAMPANTPLLCSPWLLWSSGYVDPHHCQSSCHGCQRQTHVADSKVVAARGDLRDKLEGSCSLSTLMLLFLNLAFPGLLSPKEQQPCPSLEVP